MLYELELSEQGQLAREILLSDLNILKAHGSSPVLNLIKYYDRDNEHSFFPTDVYSFHVDRSPVPTDTFYVPTMASPVQSCRIHKPNKKYSSPKYVNNLKTLSRRRSRIWIILKRTLLWSALPGKTRCAYYKLRYRKYMEAGCWSSWKQSSSLHSSSTKRKTGREQVVDDLLKYT